MDYNGFFAAALAQLQDEGNYRVFADLERHRGNPRALGDSIRFDEILSTDVSVLRVRRAFRPSFTRAISSLRRVRPPRAPGTSVDACAGVVTRRRSPRVSK